MKAINLKDILYLFVTIILLIGSFFIHSNLISGIIKESLFLSYLTNGIIYITAMLVYLFLIEKIKDYTGYYFMFVMLIKFIVLFSFFSPVFRDDGEVTKGEFFIVFIPYVFCLFFMVKKLISKLN